MNSLPRFFFAGIQSCSLENAPKGGDLLSTFSDSRGSEKGEQNLPLNHDVMQLCTAQVGLGQAGVGSG